MKKFTIDQIIKILAEDDTPGNSVAATDRKYSLSEQAIYRRRKKYRVSPRERPNAKKPFRKNARLKGLLAEEELEIQALAYPSPLTSIGAKRPLRKKNWLEG